MGEGDEHSNAILAWIRQELNELALTDAQKNTFAQRLLNQPDFIDFCGGKLASTNSHQNLSPFPLAERVQGVVQRFEQDGLTAQAYLTAIVRRPDILATSPEAIARNIQGVVDLFAADGLTTAAYLKAAIKKPSLFIQTPWTLTGNITDLVQRFAEEGLTDRAYLRVALMHPSLFTSSPETVEHNIRAVVERFRGEGMTPSQYLNAALRMPTLFVLSPATVIGHIDAVMDLADRRIFVPPKRGSRREPTATNGNPLHAGVIDFLLRNPVIMTLADDNFTLRDISAHVTGEGPSGPAFLQYPRHKVEAQLANALGHADQNAPVPKASSPQEGGDAGRHARNVLLRALVREGIVKGTLER